MTTTLLTPYEAAKFMGVHPKSLTRWAKQGRIPCIKTPGGHRRYRLEDLLAAYEKAQER